MTTKEHNIIIGGEQIPIVICKHKTARRMVLRYQPLARTISLTLPRYVTIRQGLHFVEEKQSWIAKEISRHIPQKTFMPGQQIPLLGHRYELCHAGGRGAVQISSSPFPEKLNHNGKGVFEVVSSLSDKQQKIILMPGDEEFIERRTKDWLKKLAREIIQVLAKEKSEQLGVSISKITLRDTSSHLGSCNDEGRMSFSWRLVMAPYDVLDYVVCHEVAHLLELNHSPAFWAHVQGICPEWKRHKDWLAAFGTSLYEFR